MWIIALDCMAHPGIHIILITSAVEVQVAQEQQLHVVCRRHSISFSFFLETGLSVNDGKYLLELGLFDYNKIP